MQLKRIFTNPLINNLSQHKPILGKILLLLVILLLAGSTVLGCARTGSQPKGWSGATINDNTLYVV
ncbi:hypothetical protein ACFLUS_05175, partial [Chloroflexota bacterium]